MKKVYGIGVGPGDKELITLKAYNLIKGDSLIFAPKSRGESTAAAIVSEYTEGKSIIELDFPMGEDNSERYKAAAEKIDNMLMDGQSGIFLTLGDPMTYSTYIYLMFELSKLGVEVETVPGITSYNAAASCLNQPVTLKGEGFYLCDGVIDGEILKRIDSICILKVNKNKKQIIDMLEKHNFNYVYISRCTQEGQKILRDKDKILNDEDYMSLILGRRS